MEGKKDIRVVYAALVPLIIGALALTGWVFDIGWLKSVSVTTVYMNPLSAVLFVATSTFIIAKARQKQSPFFLDVLFSLLLITIVFFRISDHLFNSTYQIDRILFNSTTPMSPVTAGIFTAIALTIVFSNIKNRLFNLAAELLLLGSLFMSAVHLCSYLFNFYAPRQIWFSHLSLNTGIAFFALNLSVFFSEKNNLARFYNSIGLGSKLWRQALPFLFVIPFLVGFLRILAQLNDWLDEEFAASVAAVSTAFLSIWLIYYFSKILNEIDGKKQLISEELLKKSRDLEQSQFLLAEASKLSKIGGWELDIATMKLSWTNEVFKIYELSESELPTVNDVFNFYAPEVRIVVRKAFEECLLKGTPFDIELPFITSKGNKIWVRNCAKAIKTEDKTTRLVGVFQDVTERKIAQEQLSVIFDKSTHAHILYNETGIINCNHTAIKIMGCDAKTDLLSAQPSKFSPTFQPDGSRSSEKAKEMDFIALENGYHQFEWLHRRQNGEEFLVEITLTPVTVDGRRALLGVWHDLGEQRSAKAS